MRLVLAPTARFDAVDEHLRRCGLTLERATPQVFPARPEPATALWVDPGGGPAAAFRYLVNPDRRILDLMGDDAAGLAAAATAALGVIPFAEIARRLRDADDESAFVAAFLAAASADPAAGALLLEAADHRDDYVALGCVRALELLGDTDAVPQLLELRRDASRAGELRLLAGEVAAALSGGGLLH